MSNGVVFSPASPLKGLLASCDRLAPRACTILLTGETGTGKEVFARYLHEKSGRASRAFVPVNCGAIPDSLLESELFGHAKGAYTGANASRRGRVAVAEGGTLFLDEIGEMPLALQVKLLRLLQEKTYEPVGSAETVTADFRLIAATNRDLEAEVKAGRFRLDLYYRLMVCPIRLPALRERPMDVEPLFRSFWAARGEARLLEPEVFQLLMQQRWPGNVRELENLVERVSVCTEGPTVTAADVRAQLAVGESFFGAPVPELFAASPVVEVASEPSLPPVEEGELMLPVDLQTKLRQLEDAYIEMALKRSQGNKKAAADMLGLQRTTLVEKLRRRRGADVLPPAADYPSSASS